MQVSHTGIMSRHCKEAHPTIRTIERQGSLIASFSLELPELRSGEVEAADSADIVVELLLLLTNALSLRAAAEVQSLH